MPESVFDTFNFTPVNGNPFQRTSGTPSPLVTEFQKSQPDPNADKLAAASSIPTNAVPPMQENWAQYAGDPTHPMIARVGSAAVEEARRYGAGIKNALQTFMGPMYGEGHMPQYYTGESGTDYAGAGVNLAEMMGGPGGERALGAGWNPGAAKYLTSLVKSKPALKPETMSAVQKLIANGPEWGQRFFETSPENMPGKGFAALATTKHLVEEAAKPKPPPVVTPGAAQAAAAAPSGQFGAMPLKDLLATPAAGSLSLADVAKMKALGPNATWNDWINAQKAPAAGPAAAPIPAAQKTLKPKVSKASTPLSPEQALFGTSGATESQLSPLFQKNYPPLAVPKMYPYDPNATGKAVYSMETAPGTSGQTLPFNPSGLPMDQASVMKRMQDMGIGPLNNNLVWWRGVKPQGPYSWDSAGVGYRDPATKDYEPGIFFHPDVNAYGKPGAPNAKLYGDVLNPHVLKSENPLVAEWKDVAKGDTYYSQDVMSKIIKDAWKKGHDSLLLKNIKDVGGNHDQLIVKHPSQLRHPQAAFDPKYKGSSNLLAARGTGVPPMVVPDQEGGDENGQ